MRRGVVLLIENFHCSTVPEQCALRVRFDVRTTRQRRGDRRQAVRRIAAAAWRCHWGIHRKSFNKSTKLHNTKQFHTLDVLRLAAVAAAAVALLRRLINYRAARDVRCAAEPSSSSSYMFMCDGAARGW